MENTKAIIYCRVSTEEQAKEGISLDLQKTRCGAYCISQGYDVADVIVDDGYSGKDLKRPGLKRVLQKLEKKTVTIAVFFKLDRLTRNIQDLGLILDKMGECGFELASVLDSMDTSTATGRLQLNIMISLAQWERETIAERTKAALDYKKEKREKTGGKRPFGYDVASRQGGKKQLTPNRKEQNTINEICKLRNDGLSLPAITKELKRQKRKNASGNTNWNCMSIKRVLERPYVEGH